MILSAPQEMSRKMVCEWGMSSLGPLTFGKKEEQIFLGRELSQHRDFSEETAREIDSEVRRLVNTGYEKAKNVILENRDAIGPHSPGFAGARSAGCQ